jgi:geranylgeranyl pyrophosphate synthase
VAGGKKIRGTLLCQIVTAFGGTLESALPRAIAVELIQAATLIHDDFVDQHRVRRNAPSIWTLEGARRAVLLGDIIFSSAIQMMSEFGRDDGLIASRAIAEVSQGAYREPLNPAALLDEIEANRVSGALYEKIIYLKTGALFAASCELGAVAAGACESIRLKLRRYGSKIGEAYQIADDLHDIEQNLLARVVTADEMTALAPALLFFVRESRPCVLIALRQGAVPLRGELLEHFQRAVELMGKEKKRRLQTAASEVAGMSPDDGFNRLAREIPRDIIRMFDVARPQISVP